MDIVKKAKEVLGMVIDGHYWMLVRYPSALVGYKIRNFVTITEKMRSSDINLGLTCFLLTCENKNSFFDEDIIKDIKQRTSGACISLVEPNAQGKFLGEEDLTISDSPQTLDLAARATLSAEKSSLNKGNNALENVVCLYTAALLNTNSLLSDNLRLYGVSILIGKTTESRMEDYLVLYYLESGGTSSAGWRVKRVCQAEELPLGNYRVAYSVF